MGLQIFIRIRPFFRNQLPIPGLKAINGRHFLSVSWLPSNIQSNVFIVTYTKTKKFVYIFYSVRHGKAIYQFKDKFVCHHCQFLRSHGQIVLVE